MSKIVSKTLSDLRPLTAADRRRLAKVRAMPDDKIDLSDIPELSEAAFRRAKRNPRSRQVHPPVVLTLELDADIATWLQQRGKRCRPVVISALRQAMLKDLRGR